MEVSTSRQFPYAIKAYVITIAVLGLAVVLISGADLVPQLAQQHWRGQWLSLVGLTLVSGLLPVKLPTVNVSISVSETFLIAGTLLFGRAGGTVLVLLDALVITTRLTWSRKLKWEQVIFNLSAGPLSIWSSAMIAGVKPLFETAPAFNTAFVVSLALFALLYFLIHSWLLAFAVAMQRHTSPGKLWAMHCRELIVNYAAGASIAALLVYNARTVDLTFIAVILPLLILLYFTYHRANKRVEAERDKNAQLNRVFMSTVEALALAIDAKDQVTHGHIRRVQRHTVALAEALGVKEERQLDAIRAAALLHDTGKLAVPEHILNKPGPLTASEFERMKVHATVGADILKSIDFPYPVEPIVRHHHENWNGTGYPEGLKGQQIPLGARILSVVDCYDALTSDRPYRPRYTRQQAEQILSERRGAMYDPWVVDGFLRILDRLEQGDTDQDAKDHGSSSPQLMPAQLEVISATQAEEREFSELRRELPRAGSPSAAADLLFRHLRRLVPAATVVLYSSKPDSDELVATSWSGIGSSALEGLTISVGERISGWAFAHKQVVMNSDAILELGPVARTFQVPLRYALAVPLDGQIAGVITLYNSDPFDGDHRRLLEATATLFAAAAIPSSQTTTSRPEAAQPSKKHVH